ncbi:bifunctional riboflavin kinase/FAD synthetase [Gryllotalpicola protaetiae]|uniref:Riboflavin biosynthesis protein n=1 Tax=Gryllotalpicola protaetiae TaxID=2419771 RepID=A0A387BU76_9MICO|nr:bifunctional riboflavin kinase/FAD synthetase [Gryllotalpicola protaetiae]AYG04487.1 bifunctional riboflavin kinase/FAD synthetase [Gryllotalpicola protaetiae]
MRVFRSESEISPDFGPSAVTIGKFDGVHSGHRAVIEQLVTAAQAHGLVSAVVTFDRNPLEIIAPERCPDALASLDQKLELLAATGVDATLVVRFDEDFAGVSAERFVTEYLVRSLRAKRVFVGSDFRFGAGNAGDVSELRALGDELGFTVELIDDVVGTAGERVSSTRIRQLLAAGDVERAERLLGRPATLRGLVVHGAKRGRELGFPTANLSAHSEGLIPADGIYAGWLVDNGVRHPAAISVGNNPTFEGVPQKQVEAHVIGETIDLYDHEVEVVFVARIRGMTAFQGIPALVEQIADDVKVASRVLGV